MSSVIRFASVTAASLALVVGSAAAAVADSDTVKDRRQDVVVNGKVGGDRSRAKASAAYRNDVTGMRVTHGSKYVAVTIAFVRLDRSKVPLNDQNLRIEIARKTITNITGTVAPAFEVSQPIGQPGRIPTFYEGWDKALCGVATETEGDSLGTAESYIKSTITYGRNGYAKVQIPRSCLGNESKIKVRASATSNVRPDGQRKTDIFGDFVSASRFKTPAWTDWLLKG